MKIVELTSRPPERIQQLVTIWESAVCATHLFLSNDEILNIKKYVPQAIQDIPHLVIVADETDCPIAFMGVAGQKLEMLFVSAAARGNGTGKALIHYGITAYAIHEVAVNEQNPLAHGFYEHMGFSVYARTDLDEQGNPYPLLYLRR